MELLTNNVKKIKGAAHKNGDVDGKCKRTLMAAMNETYCVCWNCVQRQDLLSLQIFVKKNLNLVAIVTYWLL